MLGEQLLEHLRIKFHGHWYPERPTKGSAYRSIRISKEKVDKVPIAINRSIPQVLVFIDNKAFL